MVNRDKDGGLRRTVTVQKYNDDTEQYFLTLKQYDSQVEVTDYVELEFKTLKMALAVFDGLVNVYVDTINGNQLDSEY